MMRCSTLPARLARTGCSVLALATVFVVGASPAAAQSLLGTGTYTTNPVVNGITTGPGSTTIILNPGQTVIDWVPTDNAIGGGAIGFQLGGTTATFTGTSDFAVLNNINQADMGRVISMNGTINSLVGGVQGGSVYFYSAGGFLLGANSLINVGSLVLSASPITVVDGLFVDNNNRVTFGQAPNALAGIVTTSGAQINATAGDGYVALFAPKVVHGGSIAVNGSAALVAAEAGTISFSPDGLFDITVTTGTTDGTGVSTSGTITGPASSGAGDIHRAYLVAVPKNTALTMLIGSGSNLGFDVAGSANTVGNTVVLSAGRDISGGSIGAVSVGTTSGALANLQVNNGMFTSAVNAEATGYAHLSATSAMHFFSDVTVHADGEIWFSTQAAGGAIDVDGNLSLSTERYALTGESMTTSIIDVYNVNGGGSINVDGLTTLNTNAHGGSSGTAGAPGHATAGDITVHANSGSITLTGLTASANAYGGGVFAAGVDGGTATGGDIDLKTSGNGSTLAITGPAILESIAYGGSGTGGECFSCNGDGGDGFGGLIQVTSLVGTNSSLTLNGNLSVIADGFGGAAQAATASAGEGHGGDVELFVGTGSVITANGDILLQAEGTGGSHSSGDGGAGYGGSASITEELGANGGTIVINGNVEMSGDGKGGASFGTGTRGGDGYGNDDVYVFSADASITLNGTAKLHSNGTGGVSLSGTGGDGYGGEARLTSYNDLTVTGDVSLSAVAAGGNGSIGGDAYGGDVYARAQSGGALDLQGAVNSLSANETGGNGLGNGNGGIGYGSGQIYIYSDGVGSSVTIGGASTATANASGGSSEGGIGGEAYGGDIDIYAQSGGNLLFDSDLTASADAIGGIGASGGGTAYGGDLEIRSLGTLQVGGTLTATALATGGGVYATDFSGFTAGAGYGGDVDVYAQGGSLTLDGAVTLSTDASGGTANGDGDVGGYGEGGNSRLFANAGGTVNLQSTLDATAIGSGGGSGYYGSGIGGDGHGGAVRVQATAANARVTVGGAATLDASGNGSSGQGGDGTGGTAWAETLGAATAALDFESDLSIYAAGTGGSANYGAGGVGDGGQVLLQSTAGSTVHVGGNAVLNSDATGGDSYDYSAPIGGDAIGGESRIQTYGAPGAGGTITIDGSAIVSADGHGGGAYDGFDAQGGDGTGGTGHIITSRGTITIAGTQPLMSEDESELPGGAYVSADGYGGAADGGIGGDGTGGEFAYLEAFDGDIAIAGHASVSASGYGGAGETGGDGQGAGEEIIEDDDSVTVIDGARILARNGDITIGDGAIVSATGVGGSGGYDNGYGGDYGGDGGNGTGGWAHIWARNSDLGPSSITIVSQFGETSGIAEVNVSGIGGDGGNGSFGGYGEIGYYVGGDGGNGGIGTGGNGGMFASAGNGFVTIDDARVHALGIGGAGGHGGEGGTPGAGGDGGNGGAGIGGFINIGSASANLQSLDVNTGIGDYGSITADASATGGQGGNGGSTLDSEAPASSSGAGGDATGGNAFLLVRGSLVDVDSVTLKANATGGNGGYATPGPGVATMPGVGGNATVGGIMGNNGVGVLATGRYQIPTQRGTLNAGSIYGEAIATAGYGEIISGISQNLGGSRFTFLNADGNIGSVELVVDADTQGVGAINESISIVSGNVTVDGSFDFVTTGTLSLFADLGGMTAGSIKLHAADFVPDTVDVTPSVAGTYAATSFDIATDNNFLTTAHLDSVDTLSIVASGLIDAANMDVEADLYLEAEGGPISVFNLTAGGDIDLLALGSITTWNINAGGGIYASSGGSISTSDSDISAGDFIEMVASGDIILADAVAGEAIDLNAGGSIDGGNMTAGDSLNTTSGGDTMLTDLDAGTSIYQRALGAITENDLTAGTYIDIRSGGAMALGDLVAGDYIDLRSSSAIGLLTANAGETINFQTLGTLTGLAINAGNSVLGQAIGAINLGNITAGIIDPSIVPGAIYRVGLASDAAITTGAINALGNIGFGTPQHVTTGNLTSGGGIMGLIGGDASFGAMTTGPGGYVYLANYSMSPLGGSFETFNRAPILALFPVATGGAMTISGPVNTGNFRASAGTIFNAGDITSTTNILVDSGGNMTLGNLIAGLNVDDSENDAIALNSGGSIVMGNATALDGIDFDAEGSVTGGNLTSGREIGGGAGGPIVFGTLSAGIVNPQGPPEDGFSVGISSATSITTGDVVGAESIGFASLGSVTTGNIDAGNDFLVMAADNMSFGTIDSGGRVYLAGSSMYLAAGGDFYDEDDFDPELVFAATPVASGGSITAGAINAGRFEAAAGTTLTGTTIDSDGLLYATSGGDMTLTDLSADGDVRLTSGADITTGHIYSYDDVALSATGSISTFDIFAYDDVSADAGTTITTHDITGNSIDLFADGDITTGDLLTQYFYQGEEQLVEGASITVQSGGDVDTGSIDSIDGVYVSADGSISTDTIDAADFVALWAGGNITAGTITAGSYLEVYSDSGLLDLDDLHAGTEMDLETGGSLLFGDATADDFNFETGGTVNGGNIDATTHADGHAEGAIVLENITVIGPPSGDDDFSIGFTSATSITVENVDGYNWVGFATEGNLTTGNITAGGLVLALAGGDIVTGSITTDAGGRVYMADESMCGGACGSDDDESEVEAVDILALDPVPTGGSITIAGAVVTGLFQAAAGDNLASRAITADTIEASAGGNATIDGIWLAPSITLMSGDINITTNGWIDAGSSGSIVLNAVNDDGALIGDGLTGSGYALSNAEFARISGGGIAIIVGGNGGDADTQIGDLTITGPLAGSSVEDSDGGVEFITLQEDGAELDGTLRIVGDVVATGFGAENYLGFYTQNFELDAATGSIAITGTGDALGGILEIYASRIHVAEGNILDQLAANPQYPGYREALNQQAAVQRPDGVISAGSFDIEFGGSDIEGPYTLFVQNMGTTTVPAGFLLSAADIGDDGEGSLAPGSVDMAINGQIITEGGTLTGVAVRDLLVTEFGTAAFTPGSTINGCVLTGACGQTEQPQVDTPTPTDIALNPDTGLGDGLFGNEGDIDDGESGDEGDRSNPIAPPTPLFDSRPLSDSGDIDDPVSGAGNPALYGADSDEDPEAELCEGNKDKPCETNSKGDGK